MTCLRSLVFGWFVVLFIASFIVFSTVSFAATRQTTARANTSAAANARMPAADPDLATALETMPNVPPTRSSPRVSSTPSVSSESSIEYRYRPTVSEKHFSVLIPSMVVHGFTITKDVADNMPRKLDGGNTVVTPGVGLEYVSSGGFLVLGGVLKDCYNNLAGLIQVGQQFKLFKHTTFGYSLGLYMRETPMTCTTTTNRFGRTTTSCDEFDSYQVKMETRINNESVDIIPMPFIHFTTALYHDKDFEVDLKILTNIALNEFGIAIPF